MRHLDKMIERKILIRYGPDGSELARSNRTFYRINPGQIYMTGVWQTKPLSFLIMA